eukprot:CAMPEP_0119488678 /NCGR_PEP_ID=MMETSP1344-20130328/14376_1 /TAXON_ID=236787 /ORGANISM="Florenciella parvula, Strain CCMP2471" /LENGTH=195 /DNA_ID=CAMNT_0007523653 /DNA_START=22 /DNA_END=609 /DNA_ORIENTATION=+
MAAVSEDAGLKMHSMCRWDKPAAEIQAHVDENAGAQSFCDPGTGNYPIHIAAQNGHYDLTKQLVGMGIDVNAANGTGTTPLHMSRQYGYWWLAKFLIDSGADCDAVNGEGHAANKGIEGDQDADDMVPALSDAHDAAELDIALDGLATAVEASKSGGTAVDKSALVMAGMAKKKSSKAFWTAEHTSKFQALCRSA